MKYRRVLVAALITLPLTACVSEPQRPSRPVTTTARPAATPVKPAAPAPAVAQRAPVLPPRFVRPSVKILEPDIKDGPPDPAMIPYDVASTPDPVPRFEQRSASGNMPEYEAFGEIYQVLDSTDGFRQRGVASWYGQKFHNKTTASGEPYDMFAMTGAHKTLPIPSYVRVTNLDNGRSAIVRINDRGPFHSDRIVDLSYAAAARLGITGAGSAKVELVALQPDPDTVPLVASAASSPAIAASSRWVQVAAYSDPVNAAAMRTELTQRGLHDVDVRASKRDSLHRVVVGPFTSDADAARTRSQLRDAGYAAFLLRE